MPSWARPPPSTVPCSSPLGTATSCGCVSTCARNDRDTVCLKGRRGGGGGGGGVKLSLHEGNEERDMRPFEGQESLYYHCYL